MTVLGAGRVMAIIRYREPGDLVGVAHELAAAGVPLLEITLDTPGALAAIDLLIADGLTVGAGTVLTPDQVRASADAGARFVVAPGCSVPMILAARAAGVEPIPGVLSPTELTAALEAGAVAVKVFPAGPVGGPAYVRALRGPFPDVGLLATGGIDLAEVAAYLGAGATCVGLGGHLVGSSPPTTKGELEAIGRRGAALAQAARR